MKVEIWSDVVCPWCYVGKAKFDNARERFEFATELDVVWRSFELDPGAPAERPGSYAERIARKYGGDAALARARIAHITSAGADAGLTFNLDRLRAGNTFDAHRLIHLAAAHGVQHEMKERLFRATFTYGEPVGSRETLARLAVDAGLPADEVRDLLDGDAFGDAVRADEQAARTYGVTSVPFFLIDGTYGVAGAQEPEVFLNLLDRAWAETH